MLIVALAMFLNAEPPRYLGGSNPTPLTVPGPVDQNPTIQSCSTETLRRSTACVFDARPIVTASEDARKKQAKDNLALAVTLGKGLCKERVVPTNTEAKEKARRASLCLDSSQRAANECSLDGVEALLDSEGRFSNKARACYESMADALQSSNVPLPPRSEPGKPTVNSPSPQPTKI